MITLLLPWLWLVACGPSPAPGAADGAPLRVAVSVPPQAWLVEAVGGEWVEVVSLVGPRDSAETYQPTDAQVSRAMGARLFFRGGVPFERGGWFEALASAPGLEVVDLRQGLDSGPDALPMHHHHPGDEHPPESQRHNDGVDPHLWLSPRRLRVQAGTVSDALARIDPEHAAEYRRNLAATLDRLDVLDRELSRRLAPHAGGSFYVFHPAWSYLAADYGLRQVAIEVDGKSPSDAELTRLQEAARRDAVGVIFVQPQMPHQAADAVAAELGAETVVLDPLAPDVPANLLRAADAIAASYGGPTP